MTDAETCTYDIIPTPCGPMLAAFHSNKKLCALLFSADQNQLLADAQSRFQQKNFVREKGIGAQQIAAVIAIMKGERKTYPYPLHLHGTEFQKKVWQTLTKIPFGKTSTYTEIAQQIGKPKAVRAVANACGANHLAIIIPCHRVLRSDGNISGYRWGIEMKKYLLSNEK